MARSPPPQHPLAVEPPWSRPPRKGARTQTSVRNVEEWEELEEEPPTAGSRRSKPKWLPPRYVYTVRNGFCCKKLCSKFPTGTLQAACRKMLPLNFKFPLQSSIDKVFHFFVGEVAVVEVEASVIRVLSALFPTNVGENHVQLFRLDKERMQFGFSSCFYLGINFFNVFKQTQSAQSTNTLSVQRRLIKTYRTERFTTALEADWQDYRLLLYRTFCSGVRGRTTGLQTHS